MLKFFRKLYSSNKFINGLASEIGVEKKIFKTALTEIGIDFSQVMEEFERLKINSRKEGLSEELIMQKACLGICSYARLGGAKLIAKFGHQPSLETFMFALIEYQEDHVDILDDPEAYRRDRMYQ